MKLRHLAGAAAVIAATFTATPPVDGSTVGPPTVKTADCKTTIFAGTFLRIPFVVTIPDGDGLYPPCLILTCLYTDRSRHCALQIMRPGTSGELLISSPDARYQSVRVCMFEPTYRLVTFNGDGTLRALGFCDV